MTNETQWETYRGTLTLPGDDEPREVGLFLDAPGKSVKVQFQEPVAGAAEWPGASVTVANRLKYREVLFTTEGLPVETVELVWKFNASLLDDTLAGVVIARPNDAKVSGEKGFVLVRGP
jgi:hypothetical protein